MRPGIQLPAGATARAPAFEDAEAVTELVAACEAADLGAPEIDVEDVRADWRRGNFDLGADAVVVETSGRIVAHGEVFRQRAEANVYPDWQGRGIGAWLLAWTEQRARTAGADRVGQTLSDAGAGAIELVRGHGYVPLYTSWVLDVDLAEAAPPEVPPGISIRNFAVGRDDEVVYRLVEDAFSEWPDRLPSTFEDWTPRTIDWPGFEGWHMPLAVAGEEVVGSAHLIDYGDDFGWVNQLAVRRDFRNRGIARALLAHSFGAFRASGKRTCGLSTDSRTGALGLYERVGMSVTQSYTHFSKPL